MFERKRIDQDLATESRFGRSTMYPSAPSMSRGASTHHSLNSLNRKTGKKKHKLVGPKPDYTK